MTNHLQVAMRETVKQCLEHSRHPPYKEPVTMNERGAVVSEKVAPVDEFFRLLHGWGYAVVSVHGGQRSDDTTDEGALK